MVTFLRLKGYSKLSLSKLLNISRSTIDEIIKCENLSSMQYNKQIEKINEIFDLPDDYLITSVTSKPPKTYTYSDPKVKELLDGLDNVLEIYSLYLK